MIQTFRQEWDSAKKLAREVYQISDNHIAKTSKLMSNKFIEHLKREYRITKELYEQGINVPKPEGIFNVNLTFFDSVHKDYVSFTKPTLVMEYISGKSFEQVSAETGSQIDEMNKLWKLAFEEINKAEKLGFVPVDSGEVNDGNQIWCPERNKVYLIDFEYWGYHPPKFSQKLKYFWRNLI
ncbi:MAG: hypothetical protein Q7S33_02330 [Nanoarchaeota archaeon]|nr:hypothetical protein [Nanoarchaeota archaeon]